MRTDVMERYSSPLSYAWAWCMALFGAISLNEWVFIVGIASTIGTFIVNWYYRRKDYQHKQKMRERYAEKDRC